MASCALQPLVFRREKVLFEPVVDKISLKFQASMLSSCVLWNVMLAWVNCNTLEIAGSSNSCGVTPAEHVQVILTAVAMNKADIARK